jgi:cytoskeleton protein RodZ
MAQELQRTEEPALEGAGDRLLRARLEAGLSSADVSEMTRIPERHLAAIEHGDFAALASRTYAIGFSRAYAKAVGLDDAEIVDQVRVELARLDSPAPRVNQSFEPGDPARVPGRRLAWLSALAVLAVIVALFFAWRSFYLPAASLPPIAEKTPVAAARPAPKATAPAAGQTGPIILTARGERVWVLVTDASGAQVFQKEMARGESFTVPAEARGAMLSTGRAEELEVTVGGQPLAALQGARGVVRKVVLGAAPQPSPTPESTVSR